MEHKYVKNTEKYVLHENTIQELIDLAKSTNMWDAEIYTKDIKHEDMSEKQRQVQYEKSWDVDITNTLRTNEDALYKTIMFDAYKEIGGGLREGLKEKVKQNVLNSKITAVLIIEDRPDGYNNAYIEYVYDVEKGDEEYINDEDKMMEAIKKVKRKQYSYHDNEEEKYTLIERIASRMYAYNWREMESKIDSLIKRVMRESFSYCIKQGKIIVPEEYLAKGKPGLDEWRSLKASKNKNNNMEKRMLREMIRDKKISNLNQMRSLLWNFPNGLDKNDWSIPRLSIYGNGNKAMAHKLMCQILGEKTDQELLNMTKEDVDKAYKEYWKGVLRKAIEKIDSVPTYKEEL